LKGILFLCYFKFGCRCQVRWLAPSNTNYNYQQLSTPNGYSTKTRHLPIGQRWPKSGANEILQISLLRLIWTLCISASGLFYMPQRVVSLTKVWNRGSNRCRQNGKRFHKISCGELRKISNNVYSFVSSLKGDISKQIRFIFLNVS